jgi:threonine aldolase
MPKPPRIDLYSDTVTRPCAAMRRAMAEAEVGDEQKFEDPTTSRLEEMAAEILGTEADEILMDRTSHAFNYEVGAVAALSGAQVRPLDGHRGIFTAAQVEEAVRPIVNHAPRTRLVSIEQTSNMGGGTVWPLETIREIASVARRHAIAMHMDGARLMNAVVASGTPAHKFCEPFDSVWLDFTKGLGAPVGAVLAGPKAFVREAWRFKHQFGGAMRQSGIIAAACLYALEHNIGRLAEDHSNARRLAEGLAQIPGIAVEEPETNLVFLDVSGLGMASTEFRDRLAGHGVRMQPLKGGRLRAVTHLDITAAMVDEALAAVRAVAKRS